MLIFPMTSREESIVRWAGRVVAIVGAVVLLLGGLAVFSGV